VEIQVANPGRAQPLAQSEENAGSVLMVAHATSGACLQPFELEELIRVPHVRNQGVAEGESRQVFFRAGKIRAIREDKGSRQSGPCAEPRPDGGIHRAQGTEERDGIGRFAHLRVEQDEQLGRRRRIRSEVGIAEKAFRADQEPNCFVAVILFPAEDRVGAEMKRRVLFEPEPNGGRVEHGPSAVEISYEAAGIADGAGGVDEDRRDPFSGR
jgi:hypothetical protein